MRLTSLVVLLTLAYLYFCIDVTETLPISSSFDDTDPNSVFLAFDDNEIYQEMYPTEPQVHVHHHHYSAKDFDYDFATTDSSLNTGNIKNNDSNENNFAPEYLATESLLNIGNIDNTIENMIEKIKNE